MPPLDSHAKRLFVALWCVAGLTLLSHPAQADKVITDFEDQSTFQQQWLSVNDTVMGGKSKGNARLSDEGTMVFEGNLSLRNNGGFASIRMRNNKLLLGDNTIVQTRVKGDGRTYYLSLRDTRQRMAASHRFAIQTKAGQWMDVSAPLSAFTYTEFGREFKRPALTPGDVISVGFTLADKKPGAFRLEVDSIKAVSSELVATDSAQADQQPGTIVEVAQRAGQFNTLLAAAKAAGLADALANPDANLTVFAPTDQAFADLPEGTVESLLRPENRKQLVAILAYHVIPEKIEFAKEVKTLQGDTLRIQASEAITVGKATVVAADIQASNGVIHIIDRVMIPQLPEQTPKQQAMRVLELAIDRGVPLYNGGSPTACAAIYEVAVTSLLSGHREALTDANDKRLNEALNEIQKQHSAIDRAWTLREAIDDVYDSLASGDGS